MSTATLLILATSLRGSPPARPAGRGRGWRSPGRGWAGAWLAALAALLPATVTAARADPPPRIGGTPPPAGCGTVEIEGQVARGPACAGRRFEEAARAAQAQARGPVAAPVIDAASPDVRTGVANQTATRQRMGNTFGTSVHPQRPNRPPPVPRAPLPRPPLPIPGGTP